MYFVLKISITIKLLQSVCYRLIAYFAKAFLIQPQLVPQQPASLIQLLGFK